MQVGLRKVTAARGIEGGRAALRLQGLASRVSIGEIGTRRAQAGGAASLPAGIDVAWLDLRWGSAE
ncbi:hypothetical protein SAV14893_094720 [Streptomyces avermitilis]|uniref:Uncharacterized protein n=2 Tax=Streptomyces TaxID=1883 RepID=A0A4D4N983_STRAX|nr:hypothetical protein SAVMC3_01680 [Streptomyces avermitilis]GDY70079.1 hypothetical protein SAV14893_094720 [Streptomyces avermitilis]GDY80356.1 hypothetical protein SAV31267_098410 [Streptomyces avermitilis]